MMMTTAPFTSLSILSKHGNPTSPPIFRFKSFFFDVLEKDRFSKINETMAGVNKLNGLSSEVAPFFVDEKNENWGLCIPSLNGPAKHS